MNLRASTPRAVLLLLLVFAAGVAGGVALERLWLDASPAPAAPESGNEEERRGKTVIERFSDELELTAGQEARIDTILKHYRARMHEMWKEVRPRYRTLVDSVRTEIESELTEEQVRQYRKLLERQADRRDHDDGDDGEGRRGEGDDRGATDGSR